MIRYSKLITLCFLMTSYFLKGQSTFDISVRLAPEIADISYEINDPLALNDESKSKQSYSARLLATYHVSENFHTSIGVSYVNRGNQPMVFDGVSDSYVGLGDLSMHFIDMPVRVKYFIDLGKFNIAPAIGMSYGYVQKGVLKYTSLLDEKIENEIDFDNSNFRKNNLNVIGGIELSFDINDQVMIIAEPKFNRSLLDIGEGESPLVSQKYYSFGVDFGLGFNF